MKLDLDSQEIELTCPSCSHKFKQQFGRLKNDPTINCPRCKQPIQIDAAGLRRGLEQVNKSFADLGKALGRLGKR